MPRPLRRSITYGSVCSGIEAATVAWHPLGWTPKFFSEIEPFPCSVLQHHWPRVPNFGDMTRHNEWRLPHASSLDLLVGGTPCQAFSVAGLRAGLADPRGNLTLTFLGLVDQFKPRWVVWENVPGVLSDKTGAFGQFLEGLGQLGYGWAYRILDAQYFGVAQRRRRVFVVGHSGGHWQRAAAVLFDTESLRGNPPPCREKGEGFTHDVAPCVGASGRGVERGGESRGQDPVVGCFWNGEQVTQTLDAVLSKGQAMPEKNRFPAVLVPGVTHSLRADGFDAGEDGTGRGTPLVPVAFRTSPNCGAWQTGDRTDALTTGTDRASTVVAFDTTQITGPGNYSNPRFGDPCHPLAAGAHPPAVAFAQNQMGEVRTPLVFEPGSIARWAGPAGESPLCPTLRKEAGDNQPAVRVGMRVRRLTPRECERLQGFPDDHTLVPHRGKPAADGPRYKAIGNSMAVPVMRWIGQRIATVETLPCPAR